MTDEINNLAVVALRHSSIGAWIYHALFPRCSHGCSLQHSALIVALSVYSFDFAFWLSFLYIFPMEVMEALSCIIWPRLFWYNSRVKLFWGHKEFFRNSCRASFRLCLYNTMFIAKPPFSINSASFIYIFPYPAPLFIMPVSYITM